MLDENLPTFYLKPSTDAIKHHRAFYLTHHGSQPEPAYSLHQPDPSSPSAKNCYAVALFDAYNPDILYGEVLSRPGWTQPSLSQEEVRRNGGVPPPPEPIMPNEFTIQLYEPDQQLTVRKKTGFLGGSMGFEFSMPQHTFRTPSSSTLDRTQSDPSANGTTPLINFVWRKEGRLSKDLTCFMTGKSTDPKKKKNKDPDIAVALFSALREVTIYEPNLYRIEMEDPKGLEVVLLLSAAVIKDVFFGNGREVFNISETARKNSGGLNVVRRNTPPQARPSAMQATTKASRRRSQDGPYPIMQTKFNPAAVHQNAYGQTGPSSRNNVHRQSLPPLQTDTLNPPRPHTSQDHRGRSDPGPNNVPPRASSQQAQAVSRPPPADPRSQWEIDAETARLKKEAEAERRAEEARRKEREKAAEAERKRLKKMVEQEEKEAQRKQAAIDKETERLRRKYGNQQAPSPQPRPSSHPSAHGWSFGSHPAVRPAQQQQPARPHPSLPNRAPQPQRAPQGPYLHVPGAYPSASTSTFFGLRQPQPQQLRPMPSQQLRPMPSHVKLSKKISTLW